MTKVRFIGSFALSLALALGGMARGGTIEFTTSTADPNSTATANTSGYGSDANVSVGYSAYSYNWPYGGYGTLDGGTGIAVYSNDGSNTLTMTFTAVPGYTVTLNSFNLALYANTPESVNITVTGGNSPYSQTGVTPSGSTFTTYSPNVTGTTLTLTITNLYDVGINTIVFSETPVSQVPSTPVPPSILLGLAGIGGLALYQLSRSRRAFGN